MRAAIARRQLAVRLCVALVMMAGVAGAFDLNLLFMRDVVYQPELDSAVQPAAVAVGVGFKFGAIGVVQVRLGGSGYWNQLQTVEIEQGTDTREALHSAWAQIIPGVRIPLFYQPLTAYGGIGVGGRNSAEHRVDHDYEDYVRWHDRSVWAADQTFLLGLGFQLSRRFDLTLETQRAGFTVSSELIRRYATYREGSYILQERREDVFKVGWRKTAATGIGVGLRLKL
jgi:hypothetical protein